MTDKKYDVVLFDLDGTLTDSGEGIMKCAQYALAKMGIDIKDHLSLRKFIGPPLEDSFIDFYGFSTEKAHEAVMAYRERYFDIGMYEQQLYEGVNDFLERLKTEGYTVGIATSKMERQARWVVENFHLNVCINNVYARDDKGTIHTKADVIENALRRLNTTDRSRVLMIGDRKFDIRGATECGLDSAGVLWGYGDEAELKEAGADYICHDFNDILKILK